MNIFETVVGGKVWDSVFLTFAVDQGHNPEEQLTLMGGAYEGDPCFRLFRHKLQQQFIRKAEKGFGRKIGIPHEDFISRRAFEFGEFVKTYWWRYVPTKATKDVLIRCGWVPDEEGLEKTGYSIIDPEVEGMSNWSTCCSVLGGVEQAEGLKASHELLSLLLEEAIRAQKLNRWNWKLQFHDMSWADELLIIKAKIEKGI